MQARRKQQFAAEDGLLVFGDVVADEVPAFAKRLRRWRPAFGNVRIHRKIEARRQSVVVAAVRDGANLLVRGIEHGHAHELQVAVFHHRFADFGK